MNLDEVVLERSPASWGHQMPIFINSIWHSSLELRFLMGAEAQVVKAELLMSQYPIRT